MELILNCDPYFNFNGHFYGQIDGVVMGSPILPVIAIFRTEDFNKAALDLATQQPLCWFRYEDDTFVTWPHNSDKQNDLLNHPNSIHQCIQFTMETKKEGHLPFLDIGIYRRPNGSLGHRVYRKPIRLWVPSPPIQQTSCAFNTGA
jgi:hypothetical protein